MNFVKDHEGLYDKTNNHFKDKAKKECLWERFASNCNQQGRGKELAAPATYTFLELQCHFHICAKDISAATDSNPKGLTTENSPRLSLARLPRK